MEDNDTHRSSKVSLCKGELVTGSVVQLVARCKRHDVGVVITAPSLANFDANVVHPAECSNNAV